MEKQKSKEQYQVQYLAERLAQWGDRPNIGRCLLCGKIDGEDLDCTECWIDSSAKVAETLEKTERTFSWGGSVAGTATMTIPFDRKPLHEWSNIQIEEFALTEPGWMCITWPRMTLSNEWQDGSDQITTMADFMDGLGILKRNTYTFWPCDNRDIFWSGIKELGALIVVAFGQEAAENIGLPREDWRPLHWVMRNGVIVVSLWSIEEVIETPSRLDDCIAYMRSTLRQTGLLTKAKQESANV